MSKTSTYTLWMHVKLSLKNHILAYNICNGKILHIYIFQVIFFPFPLRCLTILSGKTCDSNMLGLTKVCINIACILSFWPFTPERGGLVKRSQLGTILN